MKKLLFLFAATVLLTLLFPASAGAYSDAQTESLADYAGADEISGELFTPDELSGDKSVNVFEKTLELIFRALSDNGASVIKAFAGIVSVILLSCLLAAFRGAASGEALKNTYEYVSILVLSGVTYSVFYNLFVFVTASLESLNLVMSSLLPVTGSLYVMGGNVAAAAASNAGMLLFFSVLSTVAAKIILPFLQVAFALCLAGAMPGSVNLSSVSTLVRSTATLLMAFLFSLLGFSLYLQTTIAAASDSYLMRSVRFASGVFVPVIGNMLGEASRTVVASVSVIKSTVGAIGITLILAAVLPPVIVTVLYKLGLLLCSMAAKALGLERESRFLYELGGVTSVLLALVAGAGAVCVIGMAVFIKTGLAV